MIVLRSGLRPTGPGPALRTLGANSRSRSPEFAYHWALLGPTSKKEKQTSDRPSSERLKPVAMARAGEFGSILLGYGLCSNVLEGPTGSRPHDKTAARRPVPGRLQTPCHQESSHCRLC